MFRVGQILFCTLHFCDVKNLEDGRGTVTFENLHAKRESLKSIHQNSYTVYSCDLNTSLPPSTDVTGDKCGRPLKSYTFSLQNYGLSTFRRLGTRAINIFVNPASPDPPCWTRGHHLPLEERSQID